MAKKVLLKDVNTQQSTLYPYTVYEAVLDGPVQRVYSGAVRNGNIVTFHGNPYQQIYDYRHPSDPNAEIPTIILRLTIAPSNENEHDVICDIVMSEEEGDTYKGMSYYKDGLFVEVTITQQQASGIIFYPATQEYVDEVIENAHEVIPYEEQGQPVSGEYILVISEGQEP